MATTLDTLTPVPACRVKVPVVDPARIKTFCPPIAGSLIWRVTKVSADAGWLRTTVPLSVPLIICSD